MRPRLEKIDVNEPAVDAMRRSLITVRTNPPPAATPFTALMTGLGTDSNHVNMPGTSSDLGRVDEPAVAVCCSTLASSPEQNPRPAPVIDDADDPRIARRVVDGLAERGQHRERQRVQRLGSVQGDRGDGIVDLDQDLTHPASIPSATSRRRCP